LIAVNVVKIEKGEQISSGGKRRWKMGNWRIARFVEGI
jgi:hypothetical protein